jgi:hypothetical protein
VARDILSTPALAAEDPRYWDVRDLGLETEAMLLTDGSDLQIVDNLMGLFDYFTSADISDGQFAKASQAIVKILETAGEERLYSRFMTDYAEALSYFNATRLWGDINIMAGNAIAGDGLLRYLLTGLEKDPAWTWEQIIADANRFMTSDTMMSYEEGSLWKDVYYLVSFIADAFE